MALPACQHLPPLDQCKILEIDDEELDTSNLQTRLVKPDTKELLLSGRSRRMTAPPDAIFDATALLSDLNQLAPSVAKGVIHKDHAKSAFNLRLINDVDFHGEEEGYIAMSYCWKDTSNGTPRRVVTPVGALPFGWTKEVEQFSLPTSNVVFQAVLRERKQGEGLWIDQVCINQENEVETAMIIGAIDTIYKNARTVVIALDDIAATPDEEQFLRYYLDDYNNSGLYQKRETHMGMIPPFMQQSASFVSFFERIMNSAWFERAWCAHEMKLGQDHVFLIPCYTYEDYGVQKVIRFTGAFFLHMLELASEVYTVQSMYNARMQPLKKFFNQRVCMDEGSASAIQRPDTPQDSFSQTTSFVSTIAEVFQMKAGGNPQLPEYLRRLDANRDKMSIALSASRLPLALAPANAFSRPNTEDECLRSLLLIGLAARDPVALCTTGAPLQLHDGSMSWLFRPTALDANAARPIPPRIDDRAGQITQGSDGKAEYVQLDLIFLDIPHRSQPNALFPTHVSRARMLVDLCTQYKLQASGLWNFWQTPNHPRAPALRNMFIQTLACVFNCGPQWLLDVSTNLAQPHLPAMEPYAINVLLNMQLIFQNYILLPEGQAAMSSLLSFVSTLITSGMPWASGASERTHGPLIICSPSPSSLSSPLSSSSSSSPSPYTPFASPTPTPTYPPGKAIIFAPFAHSKTLLIAIPSAIKDPAFGPLARAWILTTRHPYTGTLKPVVSWTLQSKGVVFADALFNAGMLACGPDDVRNHRVYGPMTTMR